MNSELGMVQTRAFDSYELLAEHATTWDIDFIQLSPGPFHALFTQYIDSDFLFSKSYFTNHLHQRGSAPKGKINFSVHHINSVANTWRYLPCPLNAITIYPDNNELQSVSMPGMHKFTLSFTEDFLQRVSENIGLPPLEEYCFKGRMALCESAQLSYLQKYLTGLTHYLVDGKQRGEHATIGQEVKMEVARLLLITLAASEQEQCDRNRSKRAKAVEDIMGLVHSRPALAPSVLELCAVTGLNESRLRELFYIIFRTEPENYLESYQKNMVQKFLGGLR